MAQTCKSLPKYDVAFVNLNGSGHCKSLKIILPDTSVEIVFDNKAETID